LNTTGYDVEITHYLGEEGPYDGYELKAAAISTPICIKNEGGNLPIYCSPGNSDVQAVTDAL
jgi:hypothetical protein